MSTHRYIDRICVAVIIIAMLVTVLFMNGASLGIEASSTALGYEERLFDTSKVHQIDIVMDDWDGFIETCENEEYVNAAVIIDGDSYKNIGLRAKGNTSLSTVSQLNSSRYSLKIEFDQYETGKNYYGLDKLCLNNIIQDTTYMKDYLAYQLMAANGVASPLCSYAWITVNGEDWGLYLAVEDVEDSFLTRNYGSDSGNLYKPDSQSFGAGRGNGREFNMDDFDFGTEDIKEAASEFLENGGFDGGDRDDQQGEMPQKPDDQNKGFDPGDNGQGGGDMGGGGDNGMGSDDVKLKYIDDNVSSYSNIFDNAKTKVSGSDKTRLIESLKQLSSYENIEEVVDTDQVLRYFVVHNFLCNGDSYTGSMVHNYYLYEKDGQLSMIPWDYNLSFGGFSSSGSTDEVNSPIDSPVSGGDVDDRPMVGWIFSDESYTEAYHEYYSNFLDSVDIESLITETYELIAPYVEKDPTAFYTYEEFETGVETLKTFCNLRTESIRGQLDGTIGSTSEAQSADEDSLIDASSITISDMGSMNAGGGMDQGGQPGGDEGNAPGGGMDKGGNDNGGQPQMPDRGNDKNRPDTNQTDSN